MLNLESFKQYLITHKHFKEFSANGNPSSAVDYSWRISKLIQANAISLETLSMNINKYIELYGKGGEKWSVGRRSHESVINALKHFRSYCLLARFGG